MKSHQWKKQGAECDFALKYLHLVSATHQRSSLAQAWGEWPTPGGSEREKTSPLGKKGEGVSAFGVGRGDREACFQKLPVHRPGSDSVAPGNPTPGRTAPRPRLGGTRRVRTHAEPSVLQDLGALGPLACGTACKRSVREQGGLTRVGTASHAHRPAPDRTRLTPRLPAPLHKVPLLIFKRVYFLLAAKRKVNEPRCFRFSERSLFSRCLNRGGHRAGIR